MIIRQAKILTIILSVWLPCAALAANSWSDLPDPDAQTYEDPFLTLDPADLEELVKIVRMDDRLYLPETTESERKRITEELTRLKAELSDRGVDADWLISQRWIVADKRKRASHAGNPAIDGQRMELGGYVIPAAPEEDGSPIAYLVPVRGMCSHTPPPSPNQMVRLRLNSDWEPTKMHEPIKVTGVLHIAPSQRRMKIVDGMVAMNATFELHVAQVETQSDVTTDASGGSDWVSQLREKVRKSRASGE